MCNNGRTSEFRAVGRFDLERLQWVSCHCNNTTVLVSSSLLTFAYHQSKMKTRHEALAASFLPHDSYTLYEQSCVTLNPSQVQWHQKIVARQPQSWWKNIASNPIRSKTKSQNMVLAWSGHPKIATILLYFIHGSVAL